MLRAVPSSATDRPLEARLGGRRRVMELLGDIDHGDLVELDRLLGRFVGHGGGAVELSGVTFLPAAAAGMLLVQARTAVRSRVDLRLVAGPQTFASRVLRAAAVPHDPSC